MRPALDAQCGHDENTLLTASSSRSTTPCMDTIHDSASIPRNPSTSDLPHCFAEFLKEEFQRRHQNNPRYSLRSFATTLNISSSFLSKLFNGKRPITEKTFLQITKRLALHPEIVEKYRTTLGRANASSVALRGGPAKLEVSALEFKQLSLDRFQLISSWYHFAILELITLEDFRPHPNYIAAKLNITPFEAKEAVDRLLRLGLLTISKDPKDLKKGKVYRSNNNTTLGPGIATAATTAQQEGILKLALEALYNIPIENRSQTSMTMAIPKNRIHEAQDYIREFRSKMTALLQRKGKRDSVYQLSISFFPITKD